MTDDLEPRLRESLRRAVLPGAPAALRDYLDTLPTVDGTPRVRRFRAPQLAAAAVALLVVALGAGLLVVGGVGPASTAAPSATDRAAASVSVPSATVPAGTFMAPGISFDIPDGWSDQTSAVEYPALPGTRFVGLLARGMKLCPTRPYSTAPPTPKPTACSEQADQPGSATVTILEYTHQFPWAHVNGTPVPNSSYPTWGPIYESTNPTWIVQSPDGGQYLVNLMAPPGELDTGVAEISPMLKSLQLSAWEAAPEVVDGRVHVDTQRGFSFDYPAGWTIYYPQDISMMDSAVVTVASGPLEPPCSSDDCQRFSTPPGTIAIEFRMGNGPTAPDWSMATTTIGGQPAFGPENWGPQNATGAEEGHTWSARLADPSVLGIYASLRGPDLPALRAAMDDVLNSVRIAR